MRAIVFEEFGGSDVLRHKDAEEPHAGPGEVRVAVRAAGVNPMDWKIRHGWLEPFFPTQLPAVPGLEVAGVVDEVGEGMTGFAVGDEVVGWSKTGAYAQYALGGILVKKPAQLSWQDAVALPIATETSRRVLDTLAVREGETLLLHGAAGAVGAAAIQHAVARGLTVIGTASAGNHEYVRSLGAIPVSYGEGLVERVRAAAPQGIDAVFDAAGQGALPDSIDLRGGTTDRIVTIADMAAGELGVTMSMGATDPAAQATGLAEDVAQAAAGSLRVRVGETFALADAAKAQDESEGGHPAGKLVILL